MMIAELARPGLGAIRGTGVFERWRTFALRLAARIQPRYPANGMAAGIKRWAQTLTLIGTVIAATGLLHSNIDSKFGALEEKFSTFEEKFSTLEESVGKDFAIVNQRIEGVHRRIDSVVSSIDAVNGRIDEVNRRIDGVIASISKVAQDSGAVEESLNADALPDSLVGVPPPDPPADRAGSALAQRDAE